MALVDEDEQQCQSCLNLRSESKRIVEGIDTAAAKLKQLVEMIEAETKARDAWDPDLRDVEIANLQARVRELKLKQALDKGFSAALMQAEAENGRLKERIGVLETRITLLDGALLAVVEEHNSGHSPCSCELIRVLCDSEGL